MTTHALGEGRTVRHVDGRLGRARPCYLAWSTRKIPDVERVLFVPLDDDPFGENEVPVNVRELQAVLRVGEGKP